MLYLVTKWGVYFGKKKDRGSLEQTLGKGMSTNVGELLIFDPVNNTLIIPTHPVIDYQFFDN
jgi:hypothetical protein